MTDWFFTTLKDAIDFLTGKEGPGLETTRSHTWPWPPSVTILLLVGAAVFVVAIYLRERGSAGRGLKTLLAAVRIALICLVLFMMYGWMLHRHRTDLPDIVLMVDDSESMALVDHYDNQRLRESLLERMQALELDELSRINLAKLLLLEQDGKLLEQLRAAYNLKIYNVAAAARVQPLPDGAVTDGDIKSWWSGHVRSLQAQEPSSRLGKCVRDILEAQRGRPTAAMILLSDGVTTEGKTVSEVAEYARRKAIPLFVVGLGNDRAPRDLRVSDLLVDEVVFVGDLVDFDLKVTGSGYQGQRVTVRLMQRGEGDMPLAEETITIGPDGEPKPVRLSYRPPTEGDFEFTIDAEVMEGEANTENNRKTQTVKVRDETLRVLYVQEYPNHEFRFLKSALSRGLTRDGKRKSLQLTTVLQEADLEYAALDETAERVFPVSREELFAYDVVIFGDVNPTYLSRSVMENLVAFVEERGGGMVFISGPRHTPLAYSDTLLAKLLPIVPDTASIPNPDLVLDRPHSLQLTRLGIDSPQLQLDSPLAENLRIWRTMPPFYWMLEAADVRPAARVLAVDPTRTTVTGQHPPAICLQFVGAGKVVFHAMDSSYRWARHEKGGPFFSRYWLQTIRYLSRSKLLSGNRVAELTSDREEYRRGEPVRFRLRFFDDRLAPSQDDGVTIVVECEGSKRRQIQLQRDSSGRAVFEGTASNLPDGVYRAWVATPTLEGQPPSQRFTIIAPPGEQARLEMDSQDLRLAARTSQGKYYTVENANRIARDLPRGRQVRIESLPPSPIWNSSLLAALFVALIATEWLVRKRVGLL